MLDAPMADKRCSGVWEGDRWGEQPGPALSAAPPPPCAFLAVPDGPTQLRALNLTDESALLHWKPPQTPVDTYDVKVTALGGE